LMRCNDSTDVSFTVSQMIVTQIDLTRTFNDTGLSAPVQKWLFRHFGAAHGAL